jgi:hypothetical protein
MLCLPKFHANQLDELIETDDDGSVIFTVRKLDALSLGTHLVDGEERH